MNDILFGTIDIPVLDKQSAANSILAIDDSLSWWDSYRSTKMIPLMVKTDDYPGKRLGIDNHRKGSTFGWTEWAPTSIVEWFEEVAFDWLQSRSRIMALITQPHYSNNEHIDCAPHEVNTRQNKFRIVLQGNTDTLYFNTATGTVAAPQVTGPFLMDGGWPHGMTNNSDDIKVTLALGSPWQGRDHYDNFTLLLNRNDYTMPDDLKQYWKSDDQ